MLWDMHGEPEGIDIVLIRDREEVGVVFRDIDSEVSPLGF